MHKYYIFIAGLGAFVLLLIISAFIEIGSPLSARSIALDKERTQDISNISYEIEYYHEDNSKLPNSLSDLPNLGENSTNDPQTNKSYEYKKTSGTAYELCATFSTDSREVKSKLKKTRDYYYDDYYSEGKEHKKGHDCIKYNINSASAIYNEEDSETEPTSAPTAAKTNTDGSIKNLVFNYKWRPITHIADIVLTNAYLTPVEVKGGDADIQKSSLLVEYSVTNKDSASSYFYGGDFGDLNINGKIVGVSSDSGKSLELNEQGKVYGLFLVDPSSTSFNLEVEEVDKSQTIVLDFSKGKTVTGSLDLDLGLVSSN